MHEQWNGIPKGKLNLNLIFRTDTARAIGDHPFELRSKPLIWRIGRPKDGRIYLGLLPSALRARDCARVPFGFPADGVNRRQPSGAMARGRRR